MKRIIKKFQKNKIFLNFKFFIQNKIIIKTELETLIKNELKLLKLFFQ